MKVNSKVFVQGDEQRKSGTVKELMQGAAGDEQAYALVEWDRPIDGSRQHWEVAAVLSVKKAVAKKAVKKAASKKSKKAKKSATKVKKA